MQTKVRLYLQVNQPNDFAFITCASMYECSFYFCFDKESLLGKLHDLFSQTDPVRYEHCVAGVQRTNLKSMSCDDPIKVDGFVAQRLTELVRAEKCLAAMKDVDLGKTWPAINNYGTNLITIYTRPADMPYSAHLSKKPNAVIIVPGVPATMTIVHSVQQFYGVIDRLQQLVGINTTKLDLQIRNSNLPDISPENILVLSHDAVTHLHALSCITGGMSNYLDSLHMNPAHG